MDKITISKVDDKKLYALLFLSKFLVALSSFVAYSLLTHISLISLLFGTKLVYSGLSVVLNKSLKHFELLNPKILLPIIKHGTINVVLDYILLACLISCSPIRTLIIAHHQDYVIITFFLSLSYTNQEISKHRGCIFLILGLFFIAFFDYDILSDDKDHPEGAHKSALTHSIYLFFQNFGLSDHKLSALILFITACSKAVLNWITKGSIPAIGGLKKFNSFSNIWSTLVIFLFLIISKFYSLFYETASLSEESSVSIIDVIFPIFFIGTVEFIDFFTINHLNSKIGQASTAKNSYHFVCFTAFLLALVNNYNRVDKIYLEHGISFGLILSIFFIYYATTLLCDQSKNSSRLLPTPTSSLISNDKMSLMSFDESENGFFQHLTQTLKTILSEKSSKRIFVFLCMNLAFTFVELAYGVWTNSLGLISDGFHMFFDCAALVMGLYAAVVGNWKQNRVFTFGYHRAEILSGFINSLFLLIISASIILKSIARVYDPPEIETDRLLFVSVAGLLVNMVGIFALGHAHSHGGKKCSGHEHGKELAHSHSHSHSHGGHNHTHSSHSHNSTNAEESNMRGVYLHVLADTLGSVGVIFSSFLVAQYGWNIADPICSLFIGIIIASSTMPLFKETLENLLLTNPEKSSNLTPEAIVRAAFSEEGVLNVYDPFVWEHTPTDICGCLRVLIRDDKDEQTILNSIRHKIIQPYKNITHLTIQIEKESLLSKLSSSAQSVHKPIYSFSCKPRGVA